MNGTTVAKLAGVLAVIAMLGLGSAQAEEAPSPKKTIEGAVEVGDTDDDGNVVSVSIWDAEEGAVLITQAGKGRELLRHVGAVVEVMGTLRVLEDHADYDAEIDVESFKVLEPAQPEPTEDLPEGE